MLNLTASSPNLCTELLWDVRCDDAASAVAEVWALFTVMARLIILVCCFRKGDSPRIVNVASMAGHLKIMPSEVMSLTLYKIHF